MLVSAMLLEGIHSAFNGARIRVILEAANRDRHFNPFEVLLETLFIEIAPVKLLAWSQGLYDMTEWDWYGTYTLVPLFYLLSVDFNTSGADPNQKNLRPQMIILLPLSISRGLLSSSLIEIREKDARHQTGVTLRELTPGY